MILFTLVVVVDAAAPASDSVAAFVSIDVVMDCPCGRDRGGCGVDNAADAAATATATVARCFRPHSYLFQHRLNNVAFISPVESRSHL